MRDYQVQGLNWMIGLHHNGINGILADEMVCQQREKASPSGKFKLFALRVLEKRYKTIAFLGYLKLFRDLPGPHLVIVPKSTLDNWAREVEHWVPGFRTILLRGQPEERVRLTGQSDIHITH